MKLNDLKLSDATIEALEYGENGLTVRVKDWQETYFRIAFTDTIGFEAVTPLKEDLDGVAVDQDAEFTIRICENAGVPPGGQRCYAFISAWSEKPVLRIVSGSDPSVNKE